MSKLDQRKESFSAAEATVQDWLHSLQVGTVIRGRDPLNLRDKIHRTILSKIRQTWLEAARIACYRCWGGDKPIRDRDGSWWHNRTQDFKGVRCDASKQLDCAELAQEEGT